jgi:hypothetical protein
MGHTDRRYVSHENANFKKTEEARDLLKHHPLTPEQAIDLFTSVGVGAFRYSVYSIQDIRQLLSVQPGEMKRWLTTSQMG